MSDFYEVEDTQGVRCPWNIWPQTRMDLMRNGVPLSILYTPSKQIEKLLRVQYPCVRCTKCAAILNPFNPVDFASKQYTCCFCGTQQQLPPAYREITEQRKPAELHFAYRTLEYELQQVQPEQKIIIFCVDTCVEESELLKIKESLQLAIDVLPENTKVGLITFGTTVNVHELVFEFCPRKVVFRGTLDMTPQLIDQYLGMKNPTQRFVLPLSVCRESLTQLIEDLHVDLWTVPEKHRPFRSTGVAASIAVSMVHCLQASLVQQHKNPMANVAILSSGPCTSGPGQVVDADIAQHVRHWPDVQQKNDVAKYVKDSTKFYEKLGERALECNCAVNIFSCSTDQIGLLEMKGICTQTGGTMLISESFGYSAFTKSWRIFLEMHSDSNEEALIKAQGAANLHISVSQNIKVHGCIGPVSSLKSNSTQVSPTEVGVGSTDKWQLAGMDSDSTYAFVFDLMEVPKDVGLQNRFIQFRTEYTDATTLKRIIRVTSCAFRSEFNENMQTISTGFDQEAAATMVARIAAWRFEQTKSTEEVLRGVDRVIIKTAKSFCTFVPNDPNSVKFQSNFEFFPQFLYHFRRSDLIQLFGQSPDETTMKHFQLCRQTVPNMLSMMQPALLSFTVQNTEGEPVFLDSQECTPDRILLMDSFFNLLVWSGSTVAAWRQAGYHLKPEYANVKALLDSPKPDCEDILRGRFPSPRYDYADQGTSQARILLAKVNPASTHKTGCSQGEVVATDDVNLQQFLEVLKKTMVVVEK
ncbi:Sec23 [Hexamita inflata]|uniref:Protein transport protein SEC23 n=1 Tax=Hexamita inflata TaxID=28002 RepID=A0AA86QZW7_9EUKA|nr:Sec23 [Hexamita inflata]